MSTTALQAVGGPFMFNAQWCVAVQLIAQGTLPLVGAKWLEDELELDALHYPSSLRGSGNEKAAVTQIAALSSALGGRVEVAALSSITGVKATYLLAVALLEMIRFSSNGGILNGDNNVTAARSAFSCVFEYLKTPNLMPVVFQCLSAIVHRAFETAVSWLEERVFETCKEAEIREATLSAHTCFLIKSMSQRDEHFRDISVSLLSQLKDRFPQVLWNSSCLDSLLFPCALVNDPSSVATVRCLYQKVVREWITILLSYAPCTSQGILQEQICKENTRDKTQHNANVVSLLSEIRIGTGKNDGWMGIRTANVPAVMDAAAAASGGAYLSLTRSLSFEVLSTGFNEMLLKKSVVQLQQFVNTAERGEAVGKSLFRETCSRATALLLSNLGSDSRSNFQGLSQLLRLLCWCPSYISTPDAMETGIFIWTWLVSATPQLGSLVLEELVDAWLWTVHMKRGLFAYEVRYSGPAAKLMPQLAPGKPEMLPAKDPVEGIIAHRLWLGFFVDRFEVVLHNSVEQLLLLGRMLQGTIKFPSQFSRHPIATGTFFTVMLLGLKFCSCQWQGNLRNFRSGLQLLEDRIYQAALGWFANEPEWFDMGDKKFALSEAQSVSLFVHHLSNERVDALPSDSSSKCSVGENGSSHGDMDQYHPVWGKMDNYTAGREKRKQLLLILCQHEADRLEVWATPVNTKVNTSFPQKGSSEKWIEYARTAFSVDPHIAFSLVTRFRAVSPLKSEVSKLVQLHIEEIRSIAEALPFFVTPKEVDENSVLLQQLPHWAASSVTQALEFMTPAYKSHARVMAYILRVLESYPPERVTFFMPQLVRALRYDNGRLVEDRDGDPRDVKQQACIFKVGDDCRQDVLSLQVISLLRDIFEAVGLNLYVFPYGVLPTGPERGIIEVVPNRRSRSQMGETTDGGLYEIFQQDFGTVGFPVSKLLVITSSSVLQAMQLLVCYFSKDRHNGNLLLDNVGRLVHIDFGFIFEISPGGYLAARCHMDVLMMLDSGLPCFSRGDPIGNLRKRFHPEMTEREAANFMVRTCVDAYNKWSTVGYDLIQYLQQGVEK
ncbi:hypothetical protein MKW98_014546 [Papaver atlanticum]|uniref:Phosphatidylinositol 4-kinase n=1 Tax=Papaver atlanticum TaxID=357466 RepID=A0AAD4SYM3_9MAGN|nr:hypothetical protein MKW98_014546 [Papaver atlanticum]